MPRPDSHVIPPGWEAHHRPVSESAMTAHCVITRAPATEPVFNEATGRTEYPPRVQVYSGPCRLTGQLTALTAGVTLIGDQDVALHEYTVAVPASAARIQRHDHVTVTSLEWDPATSLDLIVTDVADGSLAWDRDVTCILRVPSGR